MKYITLTAWLLAALLATAIHARADEIFKSAEPEPGELSDLHAGAEAGYQYSTGDKTSGIVIGIRFGGLAEDGPPGYGYRLFWLRGGITATPRNDGSVDINAYDLHLTPFMIKDRGEHVELNYQLMPITAQKNLDLDVNSRVAIRAFRFEMNGTDDYNYQPKDARLLASVAVDVLGANILELNSRPQKSGAGLYIAGAHVQAGFEVPLSIKGKFDESITLRAVVAGVDEEVSTNQALMDLHSKIELAFQNLYHRAAVFVRGGYTISGYWSKVVDGRDVDDSESHGYILSGVSVSW